MNLTIQIAFIVVDMFERYIPNLIRFFKIDKRYKFDLSYRACSFSVSEFYDYSHRARPFEINKFYNQPHVRSFFNKNITFQLACAP